MMCVPLFYRLLIYICHLKKSKPRNSKQITVFRNVQYRRKITVSLTSQNSVAYTEGSPVVCTELYLQTVIYRVPVRDPWNNACLLNHNCGLTFRDFKDLARQKSQLSPDLVPITILVGIETGLDDLQRPFPENISMIL